ncbi:MAG: DUF1697 domain-containing protein [Vicinamibacteria bacterium]|jgi:uncharacterized protein (DUF1697 family)|nr:DUF1697 domain-containing protein [Vicinamibacteria bacterium]
MPHAVFLRAANVGGNNVFRPAQLARDLAALDVVNIGAAGTFVVRGKATATEVRRAFLERLPFEPAIAVVSARELRALVDSAPFAGVTFSKDLRGWVAALCAKPKRQPQLPLSVPSGPAWEMRFERLEGPFALGLWQRQPKAVPAPHEVVEKATGVPATSRWWETIVKVAAQLV